MDRKELRKIIKEELKRALKKKSKQGRIDESVGGVVGLQPINNMQGKKAEWDEKYDINVDSLTSVGIDTITENIDDLAYGLKEYAESNGKTDEVSKIIHKLGEIRDDIQDLEI